MQSGVGRQGLTSTKLGLKSHWTVGVTWTELLDSRDLARRAERRPRVPVMQFFGACVAGGRFRRPTGDFFGASSAERRQTTPTACTTRKTVEKAAGSALQSCSSRLRYFVAVLQASSAVSSRFLGRRRPEQSAVDSLAEGEERDAEEL
ncbi:hypothetical protein NDU88_004170 [Pleurodeles waltl]|uniref:Uncharacterized protein n=1 Tax=Pleurodeles waltl TaxID=8319 RepID=A0AAV7PET6_PLEWA|nr:hypothetical protein NDU88_004170 [Pleurodeles waltl]